MDFLIVYRYFTSPQNFFDQLMQKYQGSGKFTASATGSGKKGDAVALRYEVITFKKKKKTTPTTQKQKKKTNQCNQQ